MKISEILKQREKGISFEFFPPRSSQTEVSLRKTVKALRAYNPLYVSMTCGAAGSSHDQTKEAVHMLLEERELEVMPHLVCVNTQSSVIYSILDEYKAAGIENIMALRGDIPAGANEQQCRCRDLSYARDLVEVIKGYGHFCIGVAVYPEGHIETASLDQDLEYTKQKIDAGADFAVTQMFFNNDFYYCLRERMHKKRITIPVLPGILPLTNIDKVKEFASICRTTIPQNIDAALEKVRDNSQEMEKIGIEFTIKQCQDLIAHGVRHLHFFTLNKVKMMRTILDAII